MSRRHAFRRTTGGGLARTSDRVEALVCVVLIAATLLVVPAAVWLGGQVADMTERQDREWMASSYPAQGVSTDATRPGVGGGAGLVLTPVRWIDPQGIERNGTVELDGYLPAGASVALRVGPTGTLRTPREAGSSGAAAVVVGLWAVIIGWALIALLRVLVERAAISYNCRYWTAEWRHVEPVWSGRGRRV